MPAQLHFGTNNSVSFGTTGTASANTATFVKSTLANMVVGDLLVAWIHNQGSTGTVTAPSGWVRYGADIGVPSGSASRVGGIYYYPLKTQADIDAIPSNTVWSFSVSARVGCIIARASGIDLNNIEDSESAAFGTNGGTAGLTIAGINTVNSTTLLVGVLHHQNSASTLSPNTTSFLTSFQEYKTSPTGSANANTGVAMGYSYLTSTGPTGNVVAAFDGVTTSNGGEIVAFTAGTYSPPVVVTRPTIVGTPTTFTSATVLTSFTIAKPTGLIDGDALVMVLSAQTATATSDFTSSGWSLVSAPFVASNPGHRVLGFYSLPVPTATAVSASSFTFTSTDSVTGGRIVAEMFIVRGADLAQFTLGTSAYSLLSTQTINTSPTDPTLANTLLLIAHGAQFTGAIDYSIASGPSGMTQQTNIISSTDSSSKTLLAVYQQDIEAGTPSTKTLIFNGVPSQGASVWIELKGAATNPTNPGIAVKYTSAPDTLSNANMFYTSATDTLATPFEVRPVPKGYASVTNMLATTPFYAAHRGGSNNWPEMSLHAYSQSVFWGVPALEVSLARTSDGVWFGLHDSTLDRTSGTSGFTASAHTWAEVQAYLITAAGTTNASQGDKPYMRWEEIIAAYYPTHVLFVDPKSAVSFLTELLNMMDALPNTPTERFVVKYYGVVSPAAIMTPVHARGYKGWGYFYQADSANFAAYQGQWDILGMDYNADQATWTSILSYGKPVIGHIIPNATAATTALNYGAAGLMVSGVQQAITRKP